MEFRYELKASKANFYVFRKQNTLEMKDIPWYGRSSLEYHFLLLED
jgi:hypothetical protein